jgi:S-ribosylhomocysteine lyase LuxS involved in autoinducer biosynthesis
MDKVKIIIEEPSGSRRSFFYNVKDEQEAKDIVKMVEESLKPNFSMPVWKYMADKDSK